MIDPVQNYLRERGCGEHVVQGGFAGLVKSWEQVVAAVRAGYQFGLDDYLNDLDARQLLEEALSVATPEDIEAQLGRIQTADAQMKALLLPAAVCLWGAEVAAEEGWTHEQNWWYFGIPKNAGETLREDLRNE
ncbi:MAG: hypothetical protein U0Y68_10875 [Blastocatellia bacterium]